MQWNLSPLETAGVVGIGVALAAAASFAANKVEAPPIHMAAVLAGGTVIYTLGVVIGTNRPAQGWIPQIEG